MGGSQAFRVLFTLQSVKYKDTSSKVNTLRGSDSGLTNAGVVVPAVSTKKKSPTTKNKSSSVSKNPALAKQKPSSNRSSTTSNRSSTGNSFSQRNNNLKSTKKDEPLEITFLVYQNIVKFSKKENGWVSWVLCRESPFYFSIC
mgnify:CR=1 FL=1